jgi:hypothetical protein
VLGGPSRAIPSSRTTFARKLRTAAAIRPMGSPSDVIKAGLTQMGFDPLILSLFTKSGISSQGAMANRMLVVVHFSTDT